MKVFKTIHTSRTMMYAELEKVMSFSLDGKQIVDSLEKNITGKKSASGVKKSATYLKHLYGFDNDNPSFSAFKYFWENSEPLQRPLLAFIYAMNNDDLLAESIDVIRNSFLSEKVSIELFENQVELFHPQKYSINTRKSMAQNIASSWKQAGFIEGKVKNIRIQPQIDHLIACFAFLMAYLKGDRGDYIWISPGVRSLCLNESRLRELAIECGKRGLMNYQSSGNVTNIGFHDLFKKLKIHEHAH